MQATATTCLALLNLGGAEITLIVALLLILSAPKWLPPLGRGLNHGLRQFWLATRQVSNELDNAAGEAGRSVGGIYGKPAAEALTPDNKTAELYDPAVFGQKPSSYRWWLVWFRRLKSRLAVLWAAILHRLRN